MKILVTGAAGFIGFHLVKKMIEVGNDVTGIDNINDYYDPELKFARLADCGISKEDIEWDKETFSSVYSNYHFTRMNLENKPLLLALCVNKKFDVIVHLAAQAGVRYSITHPDAYAQSNLLGFLNILEACRFNSVKHLVYASSSSVYGLNPTMPFSEKDNVDHPISLYAASKKANELMAHTYSHLYNIPTTGLRFFTVYGPWGRPDMAYFIFADAIFNNKPIDVFNKGIMQRDFTFIDDIIDGIIEVIKKPAIGEPKITSDPSTSTAPYKIYNIGNNQPVELMRFIQQIELNIGIKAIINFKEMQAGDVSSTWANIDKMTKDFNYNPKTSIEKGLKEFIKWFKYYYKANET